MSIIQEALKKAQTTYAKEVVKAESPKEIDTDIEAAVNKPHRLPAPLTKLIPGVALLALVTVLGFSSFLSKPSAESRRDGPYHDVSYKTIAMDDSLKNMPDAGIGIRAEDIAPSVKSVISSSAAFVNAPELELNGIMYLQERPRAIINGNVVGVGESVNGARIDTITSNAVLLNYDNLEITLKLKE